MRGVVAELLLLLTTVIACILLYAFVVGLVCEVMDVIDALVERLLDGISEMVNTLLPR